MALGVPRILGPGAAPPSSSPSPKCPLLLLLPSMWHVGCLR